MKKLSLLITIGVFSIYSLTNVFAGEWKNENDKWRYQEDDDTYPINSWKEINGKWYYFNEGGYMLSDTKTPDGYTVAESGEWIDTMKNSTVTADKKYVFEEGGMWISKGKIPEGDYVYYPTLSTKDPVVIGSSSITDDFNYIKLHMEDFLNPGTYVPVASIGQLDISGDGVFCVGKDVKAGTYNLTPIDYDGSKLVIPMCIVFNTIPSNKDNVSPEKNINQKLYIGKKRNNIVTVVDGQYIQIIDASADFVRP